MKMSSMFSIAASKGARTSGFSNGKPKKKIKKKYVHLVSNAPKYKQNMGSEFYDTNEWRRLRAKVFQQYGYKCLCCDAKNTIMHVDHIKPRSLYPHLELVFHNLQVLCARCNFEKSNLHETDYRSSQTKKTSSSRVIKQNGTVIVLARDQLRSTT